MSNELITAAYKILRTNDLGSYTVPTKKLYPFQWNWDSCLTALGLHYIDEERAWLEIETLFSNQWDDGMVPHIIFHVPDSDYFPGADVWQTGTAVPTSGITQPPVAGLVVKMLFERASNRKLAAVKLQSLLPKIARWHDWFFANRDPERTGLVAVLHPWETGRDNSVDWDSALDSIVIDRAVNLNRSDLRHANPAHRPTEAQYQRYIWLIQLFRSLNWDNSKLHAASPFQIVDPGFNAILLRSCAAIADLAAELDLPTIAETARSQYEKGVRVLESLWSEKRQQYLCYDRKQQQLIESPSIGGILPILATSARSRQLVQTIRKLQTNCHYLIPSHDPQVSGFDHLRYWRGPVWLIMNFLIQDGMVRAGEHNLARQIVDHSLDLIQQSGFAEYYSPIDATPCGGKLFTWTAAMVMEFLHNNQFYFDSKNFGRTKSG